MKKPQLIVLLVPALSLIHFVVLGQVQQKMANNNLSKSTPNFSDSAKKGLIPVVIFSNEGNTATQANAKVSFVRLANLQNSGKNLILDACNLGIKSEEGYNRFLANLHLSQPDRVMCDATHTSIYLSGREFGSQPVNLYCKLNTSKRYVVSFRVRTIQPFVRTYTLSIESGVPGRMTFNEAGEKTISMFLEADPHNDRVRIILNSENSGQYELLYCRIEELR